MEIEGTAAHQRWRCDVWSLKIRWRWEIHASFWNRTIQPIGFGGQSPKLEIVVDTGPSDLLLLHPKSWVFVSSLVDKVPIMLLMKPWLPVAMTTSHCRPILSCFFAPFASCSLRLARFNCCAEYPRFAPWRPHEIPMSWSFPNHQKCPFAQARCCQALGSASCGFQLPAQKGSFQWDNGNQGLTFPAFVLHPILT